MKIRIWMLIAILTGSSRASQISTVSQTGNVAVVLVAADANQPYHAEVWSLKPWKRRCIVRSARNQFSRRYYGESAAFSHDGRLIAFGCGDSTVEIYDAQSGQLRARLGHSQQGVEPFHQENGYSVNSLAFSPDGKILASGNVKGVFFWDWRAKKLMFSRLLLGRDENQGRRLALMKFSPDGKTVAIAGTAGLPVFLFDVARKRVRCILALHAEDGGASALAFSPGGNRLLVVGYWNVSGGSYDQIQMFSTRSGRAVWRWNNRSPWEPAGGTFYKRAVFSSDGHRFAIASDGHLEIRDARTARTLLVRDLKENDSPSLRKQKRMLPELNVR